MRFHDDAWMQALVSPYVVFGVPVLWVFCVYSLASYMMVRKAFSVKLFMQAYNVVQILVCLYMTMGLLPCVGFPNVFGINSDFDKQGEWFIFVHYLSKYLDWFDTLWILLKRNRKQLSFLHVFHHSTIGMVWGFLLMHGYGSGTCRYGALANSVTHVIMYTHYLWTSFGLKNPLKNLITTWQIGQFYSCLVHAFVVLAFETSEIREVAWLQVCYQVAMVYLFSVRLHWVPSCTPVDGQGWAGLACIPEPSEEVVTENALRQKYIIIRGQTYDITNFEHPGGLHMANLAVGRDATIIFESAHVRLDRAEELLKSLPTGPSVEEIQQKGYTLDNPQEHWSTPEQSELFKKIRERVVEEVLKPIGKAVGDHGARGVPAWYIVVVLGANLLTNAWFLTQPSILSGAITGVVLTWMGLTIQHTANHGALLRNPKLGYLLGLLGDVACGGSSLVWRYHHQVSHHPYCNDAILDQDVQQHFPFIRLDKSLPRKAYHAWQWLYAAPVYCSLYVSIQLQHLQCLLDAKTDNVHFMGTPAVEIILAIFLKICHAGWCYGLQAAVHGMSAMYLPWLAGCTAGSLYLGTVMTVGHNVERAKKAEPGPGVDWARYQIESSSSWGGWIGCFLTGGQSLQIEHHLFPCMAPNHYPKVQAIVMDECQKRGITYNRYSTLFHNFADHLRFLHAVGRQSQEPAKDNGHANGHASANGAEIKKAK